MLISMIAMLASAAAPAQAEAAPPPVQTAAVTAAKPKLVCRRTLDTGSNVRGKKVCLTARQWDQVARDGQALGRSMLPALTTPNQ